MPDSLLDIPVSDLIPTLQALRDHGITDHDLYMLRKYKGVFATSVADALKKGDKLFREAVCCDHERALVAVPQIEDPEILRDVYRYSQVSEVWCAVMQRLVNLKARPILEYLIKARMNGDDERMEARLIGARFFTPEELDAFWSGSNIERYLTRNRHLIAQVLRERGL